MTFIIHLKVISYIRNKRILLYSVVAANNHYAGFGPATANSFRKMEGLKKAVWEELKQESL
jgi:hypothetical protein